MLIIYIYYGDSNNKNFNPIDFPFNLVINNKNFPCYRGNEINYDLNCIVKYSTDTDLPHEYIVLIQIFLMNI